MAAGLAAIPLETLTTRPQRASSMAGRTAAVRAVGATTLTSKARRRSSAAMPTVGPRGSTVAALLIRMSTGPACSPGARALAALFCPGQVGAHHPDPRGGCAPLQQLGAGLSQLPGGPGQQNNMSAGAGQPERDGAADAAPGPRNQSGLT